MTQAPPSGPRRSLRVRIVAAAAVLLAAVAGALTYATASSSPIVCTSCHEMRAPYLSWKQSTHREVACESCHVQPGFWTMVRLKFQSEALITRHARDPRSGELVRADVPDTSCGRCHAQMPGTVTREGVRTSHRAHIERGISCTYCHVDAGHAREKTGGAAAMARCTACHDGVQASAGCAVCHVKEAPRPAPASHVQLQRVDLEQMPHPEGFRNAHAVVGRRQAAECESCHRPSFCESCHTGRIPASHAAKDFRRTHAAASTGREDTCDSCHTGKFCLACHVSARPQSHAKGWTKAHGGASLRADARCSVCHLKSWCEECHGVPMPHPAGFAQTHGGQASKSPKLCGKCHSSSYCQACHSRSKPRSHLAKGFLDGGHGRMWLAERRSCATCHTSRKFCDDCHTGVRPASHGPDWLVAHGKPAAAPAANCSVCHTRDTCGKCHGPGGKRPSSHGANYLMGHAKDAKAGMASCALCHEASGCNACHRPLGKPEVAF